MKNLPYLCITKRLKYAIEVYPTELLYFTLKQNKNCMKYLYVRIGVQDGEREHTHHTLLVTNCVSLWFAAMRYVSQFWGDGERDGDLWWFQHEITAKMETFTELTKEEYDLMYKTMY